MSVSGEFQRARQSADNAVTSSPTVTSAQPTVTTIRGIVEQVRPELVISWRPVTLTLFPSPWGIPKWKTMPVFKFPKDRAAAYRLDDHFAAAFGTS